MIDTSAFLVLAVAVLGVAALTLGLALIGVAELLGGRPLRPSVTVVDTARADLVRAA